MKIKAMYIGTKQINLIYVGRRKCPIVQGPPVVLRIYNVKDGV